MRSRGWRRDLHEREEDSSNGVANGLFGVAKALDNGGDQGGVVQSLERALGDSKVVV